MNHKPKSVRQFVRELISAWTVHRPNRLAAALAYYGMFSLAPAVFVAFTVARFFLNELYLSGQLYDSLVRLLGVETVEYFQQLMLNAAGRASGGTALTTVIGLGALLYAATSLFAHLKYSLNVIWEAPLDQGSSMDGVLAFIKNRLLSFVLVIGLGVLLVSAVVANFFISKLGSNLDLKLPGTFANFAVLFGLMVVAFAIMYKVLPDVKTAWRDVWIGAAVTALLMSVGGLGVSVYLRYSNISSAFGAAGALAVMLIGVYYMAQIFLFGALFTRIFAEMYGSKAVIGIDAGDE